MNKENSSSIQFSPSLHKCILNVVTVLINVLQKLIATPRTDIVWIPELNQL